MSKNLSIIKEKIAANYVESIQAYHSLFRLPLRGQMWEQVLENILKKSDIEILNEVSSSNQRGRDLQTSVFGGISCKTSKIEYRVGKKLFVCNISGYRLQSSDNFEKTIKSLDKSFNFYFISMYILKDDFYQYSLYIIPKDSLVNIDNFIFINNVSNIFKNIQLKIVPTMSDQL